MAASIQHRAKSHRCVVMAVRDGILKTGAKFQDFNALRTEGEALREEAGN